jgi:hypothetical protein
MNANGLAEGHSREMVNGPLPQTKSARASRRRASAHLPRGSARLARFETLRAIEPFVGRSNFTKQRN